MILFALTWDINGGQMGYNSFGNVFFFGIGMYVCAVVQRDSGLAYYPALFAGIGLGALAAGALALVLGPAMLGLRGHYFAIGTLGLSIVAADVAVGWRVHRRGLGHGAAGLSRRDRAPRERFFYYLLFALAALTFARGALALLDALRPRDQRDPRRRGQGRGDGPAHDALQGRSPGAWRRSSSALAGGPVGNLVGFIDPRELAFAGADVRRVDGADGDARRARARSGAR